MTISIRGARVIDPASGLDQVGDLHIEAGKIVAISYEIGRASCRERV